MYLRTKFDIITLYNPPTGGVDCGFGLGITDSVKLARAEEKISKKKALELFERSLLDTFEVGTFKGLAEIHKYLLA